MEYVIRELLSKKEIREFIKFPRRLYRENGQFTPPIDSDEYEQLTANPSLQFCKLKLWAVYGGSDDGSEVMVGRIAGIINPRANDFHNKSRVRFGWFDFIENRHVAELLLNAVAEWGYSNGMKEIHGPLSFNAWGSQGMVIDGFQNMAQVNFPYNYSYYPEIMNSLGFSKQVDWMQYSLDAGVGVPEKLYRINESLIEKYHLKVIDIERIVDDNELIRKFFRCYNSSFSNVENFVPLTEDEFMKIGKTYFSQLRHETTCVLTDDKDEIIAFGIATPNLSKFFRWAGGKLFPLGWLYIFIGFIFSKSVDLAMVGAVPEWQNRGISSIVHTYLATNFQRKKIRKAITNPQHENNSSLVVWNKRYESELYMIRRCYIKEIEA